MQFAKKVRLLIIDNENIVLCNYAGVYMLPGGKIDNSENELDALKREIKEELGIELLDDNLNYLIKTNNHYPSYPDKNGGFTSKRVETDYYYVRMSFQFDPTKVSLTESEKNHNFQIIKCKLDDIEELLLQNNTDNPRKMFFDEELLNVINIYRSLSKRNKIKRMTTM